VRLLLQRLDRDAEELGVSVYRDSPFAGATGFVARDDFAGEAGAAPVGGREAGGALADDAKAKVGMAFTVAEVEVAVADFGGEDRVVAGEGIGAEGGFEDLGKTVAIVVAEWGDVEVALDGVAVACGDDEVFDAVGEAIAIKVAFADLVVVTIDGVDEGLTGEDFQVSGDVFAFVDEDVGFGGGEEFGALGAVIGIDHAGEEDAVFMNFRIFDSEGAGGVSEGDGNNGLGIGDGEDIDNVEGSAGERIGVVLVTDVIGPATMAGESIGKGAVFRVEKSLERIPAGVAGVIDLGHAGLEEEVGMGEGNVVDREAQIFEAGAAAGDEDVGLIVLAEGGGVGPDDGEEIGKGFAVGLPFPVEFPGDGGSGFKILGLVVESDIAEEGIGKEAAVVGGAQGDKAADFFFLESVVSRDQSAHAVGDDIASVDLRTITFGTGEKFLKLVGEGGLGFAVEDLSIALVDTRSIAAAGRNQLGGLVSEDADGTLPESLDQDLEIGEGVMMNRWGCHRGRGRSS